MAPPKSEEPPPKVTLENAGAVDVVVVAGAAGFKSAVAKGLGMDPDGRKGAPEDDGGRPDGMGGIPNRPDVGEASWPTEKIMRDVLSCGFVRVCTFPISYSASSFG